MPKEITVVAAAPANYHHHAGLLILAVLATRQDKRTGMFVILLLLLLFLFWTRTFVLSHRRKHEIAIVVFPLGLQQITRDGHDLSVLRFWPSSDILDCIVIERILVHAVRSVVCLRIRDGTETTLVEAFPGATTNSYEQCLELRAQILAALNRIPNNIII